jgi:hypothetical protein
MLEAPAHGNGAGHDGDTEPSMTTTKAIAKPVKNGSAKDDALGGG